MTLREQYTKALTARGERLVKRSFKFEAWTATSFGITDKYFYLGRAGALRVGPTMRGSVPCQDRLKKLLKMEANGEKVA